MTSGAADVRVANVGGQTQVNLGGGRVYIGSSHASTIQTGAGSIQVQKCIGDLHVTSGGGNLYLGDVDGAVQAETKAAVFGWRARRVRYKSPPAAEAWSCTSWAAARRSKLARVRSWWSLWAITASRDSFLHTASGDVKRLLRGNEGASRSCAIGYGEWTGSAHRFSGLECYLAGRPVQSAVGMGGRRNQRRRSHAAHSHHDRPNWLSQMSVDQAETRAWRSKGQSATSGRCFQTFRAGFSREERACQTFGYFRHPICITGLDVMRNSQSQFRSSPCSSQSLMLAGRGRRVGPAVAGSAFGRVSGRTGHSCHPETRFRAEAAGAGGRRSSPTSIRTVLPAMPA